MIRRAGGRRRALPEMRRKDPIRTTVSPVAINRIDTLSFIIQRATLPLAEFRTDSCAPCNSYVRNPDGATGGRQR
ncbi:hypothetical protein, partial [Burkholderia sp. Ac-20392]|uniref:hypothetical protein n=1 Tax=Burkholderia sp. Ac-20392 TaxID=2703905 RepID=UPI00197E530B